MLYEKVKAYVTYYQTHCPAAPYTGYMLLGLFAFVLFVLWRRAAVRAKVAKASLSTWERIYGTDVKTDAVCNDGASLERLINVHKAVFDNLLRTHQITTETAAKTQSDLINQVVTLVANGHANALTACENVVSSLTTDDE